MPDAKAQSKTYLGIVFQLRWRDGVPYIARGRKYRVGRSTAGKVEDIDGMLQGQNCAVWHNTIRRAIDAEVEAWARSVFLTATGQRVTHSVYAHHLMRACAKIRRLQCKLRRHGVTA